jgi:hypothetical protein
MYTFLCWHKQASHGDEIIRPRHPNLNIAGTEILPFHARPLRLPKSASASLPADLSQKPGNKENKKTAKLVLI